MHEYFIMSHNLHVIIEVVLQDTFMPQAEPGIDDDMDMMAADEVQGQSHPQRDRGAYGLSQAKKSQGVRGRGHGSNLKRQKKTAQ